MSTPRLLIEGKEIKNVTQTDIDTAKHVIDGSKASGNEDISFGFKTIANMEKWLGQQSTDEQQTYHFLLKLEEIGRKQQKQSVEQLEAIKQHQVKRISRVRQSYNSLLSARGIQHNDIQKLNTHFRSEARGGGEFLPMVLYSGADYTGDELIITTGVYPDLRWDDFNNITTSYANWTGAFKMWQKVWFGGKSYTRLYYKFQPRMQWWNNRLSAIVYGSYEWLVRWLAD